MVYDALYIYGIINGTSKKVFPGLGIGEENNDVYCIPFKDLSAVVSRTAFEEYDPTEDNVVGHEKVIQEFMRHDLEIAPMRFCTVVRTERDVIKLLNSGYNIFKLNLMKTKNKQEFDVKAFLITDKLMAEVKDDDELLEKSRDMATQFYELLDKITDKSVLSDQVTREMIMNASFLIHKDKVKEFYDQITEFDSRYSDKLKIRISGPTAPYNFVSMPKK
jgi:hypothetical protein